MIGVAGARVGWRETSRTSWVGVVVVEHTYRYAAGATAGDRLADAPGQGSQAVSSVGCTAHVYLPAERHRDQRDNFYHCWKCP